jgi:hypothetical protein
MHPPFRRDHQGAIKDIPVSLTGFAAHISMAIADDLILATFDKRISHLAGEHVQQVLILGA